MLVKLREGIVVPNRERSVSREVFQKKQITSHLSRAVQKGGSRSAVRFLRVVVDRSKMTTPWMKTRDNGSFALGGLSAQKGFNISPMGAVEKIEAR